MKTKIKNLSIALALLAVSTTNFQLSTAHAQGTAFTYQGQLSNSNSPANGSYDLTFSLFDASANGTLISGPLTNSPTAVSNGLFTVTLDFGANFPGEDGAFGAFPAFAKAQFNQGLVEASHLKRRQSAACFTRWAAICQVRIRAG